jgi:Beta protein
MMPQIDGIYVPGVKWRQGEYQALLRLADSAKERIVPLITIPPIEYDFDDGTPKHTVHEHVEKFPTRYKQKWKFHPAWIDVDQSLHTGAMLSGASVYAFVFDELRKFAAKAVPVSSIDYQPAVVDVLGSIIAKDKLGICVRVRLEHLMLPDFSSRLRALLKRLKVNIEQVDLIVDLGTPAYEPYKIFSDALKIAFEKIVDLDNFRNFVLMGTAFPESLGDILKPGGTIERHDWKFYCEFIKGLPAKMRRPAYGDYTIVHPNFVANMDMRTIKPAGKLVYTSKGNWMIRKGGAFRSNPSQMHDHCDYIVKSGEFKGAAFSAGDDYIERCALKDESCSTLTRWKEIGINHHIMHVLEDVAKFGGSP